MWFIIEVIEIFLGGKGGDLRLVTPDKPDAPDYGLTDLGRELRNFGAVMVSLVRGRWDR